MKKKHEIQCARNEVQNTRFRIVASIIDERNERNDIENEKKNVIYNISSKNGKNENETEGNSRDPYCMVYVLINKGQC